MPPIRPALAACLGLALAACAAREPATLANPAATFCAEKGGAYTIRTDEEGAQSGICRLPDGSDIDAWEYYRANASG